MSIQASEQIILENNLEELARLAAFIETFCVANDIAALEQPLQLCLDEAVTNVISYGFPEGGLHSIRVSVLLDKDRISAVVRDGGIAFNPLEETVEADTSAALEDREIGGLGVHFMKHFMDDLHYERVDDENILTMIKNR